MSTAAAAAAAAVVKGRGHADELPS